MFICDFPPGFTGAKHHGEGVGGTEALVVVLAETLAARGIAVTVASQIAATESIRGVSYVPVGVRASAGSSRYGADQAMERRCGQRAGPARFFLATDVHVPDPAALARCIGWSTVSAALSPFMRDSVTAVVRGAGHARASAAARARRLCELV